MQADLTLEIGAGHHPSPAADVVVDKFLFDNTERGGDLKIVCPTVIADGECLPFREKAFARTIGRQVMEHMNDIGRFFEELTRVSSSGYLASPSYLRELVFWWPYHKWLIALQDGQLVCAPKTDQHPLAGQLFHYLSKTNPHFRRFLRSLPVDVLNVQYTWSDRIEYRLVDTIEVPSFATFEEIETFFDRTAARRPSSSRIKRWVLRHCPESAVRRLDQLRSTYYRVRKAQARRGIDLDALLVCPACKQDVRKEPHQYVCLNCDRRYAIENGVPIFLLNDDAVDSRRTPSNSELNR